ncbi:MAG: thioredoxin family protein [Rhizobiaceae bacterium]
MVRTESTMMPLGTRAPDFALPDTEGKVNRLADFAASPALVVIFMCNHCPYVKHLKKALADFAAEMMPRGCAVVAINSNDAEAYPADSPEEMARDVAAFGYPFPYLYDESQDVARAYDAVCTPEFFLFDAGRSLVYRGQFDASRPRNDEPVTGADLRAAVEAVLAGTTPAADQSLSVGCSIKWKAA